MAVSGIDLGKYKLGWHDSTSDYVYAPKKGSTRRSSATSRRTRTSRSG